MESIEDDEELQTLLTLFAVQVNMLASAFTLYCYKRFKQQNHKQPGGRKALKSRRWWIRPRLQRQHSDGTYNDLVKLLRRHDKEEFTNYFGMSLQQFDYVLSLIRPLIVKQSTRFREAVPAEIRLAITLRYMASGCSQKALSHQYSVGRSTVSGIIRDCTEALWMTMEKTYLKTPTCHEDWLEIASGFEQCWNFPNCIGALGGKQVQIQSHSLPGSHNSNNNKGFLLMTTCDSSYRFTMVDIGNLKHRNDDKLFTNSWFGEKFHQGTMNVPPPRSLTRNNSSIPYVLVANESFPLDTDIMRPFPGQFLPSDQQIFNYRLSRARGVADNAFGILEARWKLLQRPIDTQMDVAISICKAIICLHNYLRSTQDEPNAYQYCPDDFVDHEDTVGNVFEGQWRVVNRGNVTGLLPLQRLTQEGGSSTAKTIRDNFKDYFNSPEGSVSWQNNFVVD